MVHLKTHRQCTLWGLCIVEFEGHEPGVLASALCSTITQSVATWRLLANVSLPPQASFVSVVLPKTLALPLLYSAPALRGKHPAVHLSGSRGFPERVEHNDTMRCHLGAWARLTPGSSVASFFLPLLPVELWEQIRRQRMSLRAATATFTSTHRRKHVYHNNTNHNEKKKKKKRGNNNCNNNDNNNNNNNEEEEEEEEQ